MQMLRKLESKLWLLVTPLVHAPAGREDIAAMQHCITHVTMYEHTCISRCLYIKVPWSFSSALPGKLSLLPKILLFPADIPQVATTKKQTLLYP